MTKVVVENMRPPTQPVKQARLSFRPLCRPNLSTNARCHTLTCRHTHGAYRPETDAFRKATDAHWLRAPSTSLNTAQLRLPSPNTNIHPIKHTFPTPLTSVCSALASGIGGQAGFSDRFIEVMTACWDSGSSRSPTTCVRTQSRTARRRFSHRRMHRQGQHVLREQRSSREGVHPHQSSPRNWVVQESDLPSLQIRRGALRWTKCATLCTRCTAPRWAFALSPVGLV